MLPENQINYPSILEALKEKIRQARVKATYAINAHMLAAYWEIGNTILLQQKKEGWGAKVTKRLAIDLKAEFPDMKGLSERNLVYMQTFAAAYPSFQFTQGTLAQLESNENQQDTILQGGLATIVQPPIAQLSWYHHITLLDKVKTEPERHFYIHETAKNGWSRDVMVHQIESGLYQRTGKITSNFTHTVPAYQSELVQQVFKDPYKFDFVYLGKEAKERDIEDALTQQLTKFLLELGQWFSFMGRQYRMVLGEKEYFFDLLFYHTRLKRYIVIELKIDEFKPEYKGKMEYYLTLADEQLKSEGDEPSIGLILCKTKDGLVAEYALRDSSKPIGIAEYRINEALPANIKGEMPTIEELEAEIEKEYEELKTPTQKRFEGLKAKLAQINKDEIKQTATTEILFGIIDQSVVPLYTALIKRMTDFKDWFYSSHYSFQGNGKEITDVEQLAANWKDENFLKSKFEFYFTFWLRGFKKAGTEGFDAGYQINFKIDTYSYGFAVLNHNNHQPFIKKLYHEQLTPADINKIVDTVCEKVMDDIDRQVEQLKSKENE
jgi:predicted nuclease of restriction endonuclease-like (RecB) superfamily